MSDELLRIVLRETFLSWDLLLVVVIPLVALIVLLCCYRGKPLGSSGAWNRIGRRFALLGAVLALTSVVVSLACLLFCQSRRVKLNRIYSEKLSKSFEEYFVKNKDFTARMMDFAGRIEKGNGFLHNQIHIFAENLPQDERERLGKAWVAGGWGTRILSAGDAFSNLSDSLYWDEEKIEEYKKENDGLLPAAAANKYTPEQIEEYKKQNWPKLYPMLDREQWLYITNQMLRNIDSPKNAIACLRDITTCFQVKAGGTKEAVPTKELKKLYEVIRDKACPTQSKKVEVYLWNKPAILKFYQFSLAHRLWIRPMIPALVFLLIGMVMLFKGRAIAADGARRNLFK